MMMKGGESNKRATLVLALVAGLLFLSKGLGHWIAGGCVHEDVSRDRESDVVGSVFEAQVVHRVHVTGKVELAGVPGKQEVDLSEEVIKADDEVVEDSEKTETIEKAKESDLMVIDVHHEKKEKMKKAKKEIIMEGIEDVYSNRCWAFMHLVDNDRYAKQLVFALYMLREVFQTKYDIAVMLTNDVKDEKRIAQFRRFADHVLFVDTLYMSIIDPHSTSKNHMSQLTKAHLWRMTQYEQICYMDSDHVLMRDMDDLFEECGEADFCAVKDPMLTKSEKQYGDSVYYNLGFFVFRPKISFYHKTLKIAANYTKDLGFSEQGMFNYRLFTKRGNGTYVDGTWKEMNSTWNQQHTSVADALKMGAHSLHNKLWYILAKERRRYDGNVTHMEKHLWYNSFMEIKDELDVDY